MAALFGTDVAGQGSAWRALAVNVSDFNHRPAPRHQQKTEPK